VNQDGFKPNLETHLVPLLSTRCEEEPSESKEKCSTSPSKAPHHPELLEVTVNCSIFSVILSFLVNLTSFECEPLPMQLQEWCFLVPILGPMSKNK